jgi:hypothetical protein
MMAALCSTETSVLTRATPRKIPEDAILQRCSFHIFLDTYFSAYSSTLTMEAILCSDTSYKCHHIARRHIPEYVTLAKPYSVQHKDIMAECWPLVVGFPFEARDIQNISEVVMRLLSFPSVNRFLSLSLSLVPTR